jgi:hypothetical protein
MIRREDLIAMKAIALCYKPFLKPEEAMIYTNLGRTQFSKKCDDYGVYKKPSGYYTKEDLDRMLSGEPPQFEDRARNLRP